MTKLLIALLLTATTAHAHAGPDSGLHHALPLLIVWAPLLKAIWDHYTKRS